jgi:hypothetical protein
LERASSASNMFDVIMLENSLNGGTINQL